MQKAPTTKKRGQTCPDNNSSTHANRNREGCAKKGDGEASPKVKVKVGRGSCGRAARVTAGVVDRGAWARDSFRDVYVGCVEFLLERGTPPSRDMGEVAR